jgi:hypothetical protein
MTFRVYVRWPGQRTSDKTSTTSREVAEAAFRQLRDQAQDLRARGALGIALTHDRKQVDYLNLLRDVGAERA